MIKLQRTNSDNSDFIALVKFLDADLAEKDGNEHVFYAQLNKMETPVQAVVVYQADQPAGCGAIREWAPGIMEVKRMYTSPELRGKGIATRILTELEKWAAETGAEKCVLETGKRQPEAIALYKKMGYQIIPNYGKYQGIENSICFEKKLVKHPGGN